MSLIGYYPNGRVRYPITPLHAVRMNKAIDLVLESFKPLREAISAHDKAEADLWVRRISLRLHSLTIRFPNTAIGPITVYGYVLDSAQPLLEILDACGLGLAERQVSISSAIVQQMKSDLSLYGLSSSSEVI
jgi:gamma-glutamylcyclotransferase (GGCT)/AIG2-like uncharacterized protein YtfP